LATNPACAALIRHSTSFVDALYERVDWSAYDVVGFSLMFQQLLASLALAKRIRQNFPRVRILFGGPSCDDCMGLEMLRSFAEIDYVAIGEADQTIAPLIREIAHREPGAPDPIQTAGVAFRDAAGAVCMSATSLVNNSLDELPTPNYDAYFKQLRDFSVESYFEPVLYMEGSRGCWWGQKSVCTFCGLNSTTIAFRRKSPERFVNEAQSLSARYSISRFWTSDNILDHHAYKTLLPLLTAQRVERDLDLTFFFEIKSNIKRAQVEALRNAGITWVQPGIESFSDHILELMHKGCTGILQIQLLKYLAELSMSVDWNILFANPNETPDDYDEMIDTIEHVHHLPPPEPGTVIPVTLQRFTRYHVAPHDHGITAVRPSSFYEDVFPRDDIDLARLVYTFEYEHPDQHDRALAATHARFFVAVQRWREAYRPQALVYRRGPGFVEITDRRPVAGQGPESRRHVLRGLRADLYLFCEGARAMETLETEFGGAASVETIHQHLDWFIKQKLMYKSRSNKILSLALRDSTGRGLVVQNAIHQTLGRAAGEARTGTRALLSPTAQAALARRA
jgi:ribosomal peptide maturation radical SAM protein 1